jgi:TonB-dependent starch-binding outer membrane protein SusC
VFLNGVFGNEILNATFALLKSGSATTNEFTDALNRWTPQNPSNTVPRANAHRTRKILDSHIEDGSFLRLQNVTLGYTLPERLIRGASRARLTVSGQNLWTWTSYSGYDPEVSSFASDPTRAGIDRGTYPRARTVNVGVDVTF